MLTWPATPPTHVERRESVWRAIDRLDCLEHVRYRSPMRPASLFVFLAVALMPPGCSADSTRSSQAGTSEVLAADTPRTTVAGNTFIAPAGWKIGVRGAATILESPESGSRIALVDVRAADANAAVAAAWAAYPAAGTWPLKVTTDAPDKDGW